MKKPTRKQQKGYAVLCSVLVVVLLIMVFLPRMQHTHESSNHSQLKAVVERKTENGERKMKSGKRRAESGERRSDNKPQGGVYRTSNRTNFSSRTSRKTDDFVIELNSADTAELRCLYGIGPVFAKRIVQYRNLLGGFFCKEQLLEVYGMDEDRYAGIVGHIVIDTTLVKKLAVNELSIAELKRHPYLDFYQAKAIVDYRKNGKHYGSFDDLRMVDLIDDETVTKLKGYIQFN